MNTLSGYSKSTLSDLYSLTAAGGHFPIHSGRNNEVNKLVRTDANGYLNTGWINTTSGEFTGTPNRIYASNDAYIRYMTPANFFPTLTNTSNQLDITIGGQNRKLTIDYSNSAGSATQVTVTNSDSDASYRMVWHSGNNLYSTAGIYCNPSKDSLFANFMELQRVTDHGLKVGTIRGTAVGSRTGQYIHMYERVHIGSPSGWGSVEAPANGLSTYGGAWFATNSGSVGVGTTSPSHKLHVSGDLAASTIYANRTGSSTSGGISLYSNSDPMTYGIAFRGTSTYGTHGYVTADWATYLTMNDQNSRGWIFRRGSTNVASIDSSGQLYTNGRINGNYFTSRVATGTQPYACTSTTLNTNLNADLLDGYHASKFVTIDTAQTITEQKNFNTATNSKPLIISRNGGTELVKIGVNDSQTIFDYTNDEKSSSFVFKLTNTDSEGSDGSGSNTSSVTFTGNSSGSTVTATKFVGAFSGNLTGVASQITCTEASSNYSRPIVGTNMSNNLYYTQKATVNWSTGVIKTTKFEANASVGPHFTATSTSGNWSYLRLHNSTCYWDIATNDSSSQGTGGLWLARYNGDSNGIFVSTGNRVGISTSSPSDKLHVNGGQIRSTFSSRYLRIGPQNSSHAHYETDADKSHWFNKQVEVNGHVNPYRNNSFTSGTSDKRWSNVYSVLGNFTGNVTLYSDSGDSPHLYFQRGTTTDGTYDWDMFVTGGSLNLRQNNAGTWNTALTAADNYMSTGWRFNVGKELSVRDQRFNYGLAYYNYTSGTVTGTIVITFPTGWTNSMNTYEVDIYEYIGYDEDADNVQHSKLIIDGYNYSGDSKWHNYGYTQIGSYNKGIRLGYNGSKCVIMLGTTTTKWTYPQVHLSRVITGYSSPTAWSTGYSISVITDESSYSGIVTVDRLRQRFADVVANTFRGTLSGRATSVGDGTIIMYPQYNNEINFGGSDNSSTIYFGYRAINSKPIPTKFIFGESTGTATLTATKLYSPAVLYLNGVSGVYLKYNDADASSLVLTNTYFKPFDAADNKLTLGSTSARWSNVYSYLGNFKDTVHIYADSSSNYTEGIRLYGTAKDGTWSIINFGCDPAASNGTHANQWLIGRDNNNRFVFRNNTTDRLYVLSDGKVGINVVPTQMLHVNGNAMATNLGINSTSGGGNGISLYGGIGNVNTYGIAFVKTANWETHGYVTSDWATYFTMSDTNSRGWIFRRNGSGNVFSVDTSGKVYANGCINGSYYNSRVATGTQPYACTSTTLNTNLNADLLDGYHASALIKGYYQKGESITVSAAGWYKIASYSSTGYAPRGSVKFMINTSGGSYTPGTVEFMMDLSWSMESSAFLARGYNPLKLKARFGKDANNMYIEVYFPQAVTSNCALYVPYSAYCMAVQNDSWTWYTGALVTTVATSSSPEVGGVSGLMLCGSAYAAHFYENSDIALKTNIQEILDSNNIPQLKSFDWKLDGKHSYGLIAQELEEMGYSELVDNSGPHKTVNYSAALSLIVGKLQVKIRELEKEIENLKNKN